MPSAVIRRIDYHPAARELVVTFVSGDVYAYAEVPAEAYEAFRAAFSKGRHFAARVRNRYRSRLVRRGDGGGDPPECAEPVLF